jgi:hypothetical protein
MNGTSMISRSRSVREEMIKSAMRETKIVGRVWYLELQESKESMIAFQEVVCVDTRLTSC